MIMDNIERIAALDLDSKRKTFRLLRSTSQTSFTEKCLEPSTDLSVCYLEGPLSNERCTSAESVVVPCSESHCLSHSSSDTLTDTGDRIDRQTVLRKVKPLRAICVPRGGSLEDSLSPVAKSVGDDSLHLHSICITSLSIDNTRGK